MKPEPTERQRLHRAYLLGSLHGAIFLAGMYVFGEILGAMLGMGYAISVVCIRACMIVGLCALVYFLTLQAVNNA